MAYDAVVTRDDPRFPTVVRGLNQRWVGDPSYVELCSSPDDVVRALQRALDHGHRPTVRSGGHCYEGFVTDNTNGVILDLSPMRRVLRDEATGRYGIEAGATLGDVYVQLYKRWGVTIPGGSCFPVGAGGHICGGGYGLLSRLHGLTVDHLSGVDVVVVEDGRTARLVSVRRDSADPDDRLLFWAHTGGGGGNFGVVTTYWFDDPPAAPGETHLLTYAWNWSDLLPSRATFTGLLTAYGEFLAANSAPGSPYAGLFSLLHLTSWSAGQVVLTAQYVGPDPSLLDRFGAAMGSVARPASTSRLALPWLFVTETLGGSGPPQRGKYKSAYMRTAFPPAQIDTIWGALTDRSFTNPQALLQVDSYGCQVNAVAPGATAVPQRSSVMKLQYQVYWTDPADDDVNLAWIRRFYDGMYGPRGPMPDGVVDGAYVNYPDVDLVEWPYLYYLGNYPSLQRAKLRWDPHDVFHHRQSVRLPASGESAAT